MIPFTHSVIELVNVLRLDVCGRTESTVEPQSYGLHSYGKLGQPDTEIECIFGKYHQNFYKMGTGHQV